MAMQIIEEGPRNLVIKFSDVGPDTVDVSALAPPCEELRIMKIISDIPAAGSATLSWDAAADVVAWTCHPHAETACFEFVGGLVNNAGAGVTGDVIYAGVGATTNIVVHFRKVRTQHPYPN